MYLTHCLNHLCIGKLMQKFPFSIPTPRLEELNLSWCDFSTDHVKAVVSNIPSNITQLNLSGYRQNLTMKGEEACGIEQFPFAHICIGCLHISIDDDELNLPMDSFSDLKDLVERCPHLVNLDLR